MVQSTERVLFQVPPGTYDTVLNAWNWRARSTSEVVRRGMQMAFSEGDRSSKLLFADSNPTLSA
jgi:hypothetical protein